MSAMHVDLAKAAKVMVWNRRLCSVLGIWPLDPRDFRLAFFIAYLFIHTAMAYADLFGYTDRMHVIANITENTFYNIALCKIALFRINKLQLCLVLEAMKEDFKEKRYGSIEEKQAAMRYISMARVFVQTSISMTIFAALIYYLRPLTGQITVSSYENVSTTYVLPYQVRFFFELTDLYTYILVYAYEFPVVIITVCGYTTLACLLVTLTLHVCGQLSVLAFQVSNITTDPNGCHHAIRRIVRRHIELMWMAKTLRDSFNILLLTQLIGSCLLICFTGYNVATNSQSGTKMESFVFSAFAASMVLILYGYCFIGECLIHESTNLHDAFYNCEWQEMSPTDLKSIIMCMVLARKPLILTAGNLFTFSLSSFGTVMKTSMAYISVLQTSM